MRLLIGKMGGNLLSDEPLNVHKLFGSIRGGIAIEQTVNALHRARNQFMVDLRGTKKL